MQFDIDDATTSHGSCDGKVATETSLNFSNFRRESRTFLKQHKASKAEILTAIYNTYVLTGLSK